MVRSKMASLRLCSAPGAEQPARSGWGRLRRHAAGAVCAALLLQSTASYAEAVTFEAAPRPWLGQASAAIRGGVAVAYGTLPRLASAAEERVAYVAHGVRMAAADLGTGISSRITALMADGAGATAAAAAASLPPTPPGFGPAQGPGKRSVVAAALAGDVPVAAGWNLLSLPAEPADTSPQAVFSALGSSLRRAFAYEACDASDPWKVYDPADAAGSDLTSIDTRPGLWVDATQASSLPSPGAAPPSTTIHLCPGWNLIGFPAEQARPVSSALSSIAGKYERVFGYDASDLADPWEVYDVAAKFFFIPDYGGWQIETFGPTMGVIGYFARRPESNQLPQLSPSYMAQLAAASLMTAVLASIALEAFRASRGFA